MVNLVGAAMLLFIISALVLIYIRFRSGRTGGTSEEGAAHTAQDLLGVAAIRGGVLMAGKERYCRIVAVDPLNYLLLSDEESERLDAAYAAFLASLSFPVQFYTQTRLLDLSGIIDSLDADISIAPDVLKPYGAALREGLHSLINTRSVMLRNSYIVIVCAAGSTTDTHKELNYRQQTVLDGLMRCGLAARPLNDQQIADLLYAIYNSKTRALIAPLKLKEPALFVKARHRNPAEGGLQL